MPRSSAATGKTPGINSGAFRGKQRYSTRVVIQEFCAILSQDLDGLRMNAGRSMKEETDRLSFVTNAPLERLIPHGQIGHYPGGMQICAGKQLSEAAYLVLSGSCELRRAAQNGPEEVLKTIGPGAAFGSLEETQLDDLSTAAIATADTV